MGLAPSALSSGSIIWCSVSGIKRNRRRCLSITARIDGQTRPRQFVLSKRDHQKFKRRPRDFYATPAEAVVPLLGHLPPKTKFDEPCAGEGALIGHLERAGHVCVGASDINENSQSIYIWPFDVMEKNFCHGSMFITNPPWPQGGRGEPTLSIALHLSSIAPTWLLLSADFMHNKYFNILVSRCLKIVSVGRVSWMGNGVKGFDNCAWYLFEELPGVQRSSAEFYA